MNENNFDLLGDVLDDLHVPRSDDDDYWEKKDYDMEESGDSVVIVKWKDD